MLLEAAAVKGTLLRNVAASSRHDAHDVARHDAVTGTKERHAAAARQKREDRKSHATAKKAQRAAGSASDAAVLRAQLAALDLRVEEVEADGNCFFRAARDQLHGSDGDHAALRAELVAHMRDARELYEPFVEDDEPFDAYTARMASDGEWAGQLEVQALARVRCVGVAIHQARQPPWLTDAPRSCEGGGPSPEAACAYIHLAYEGGDHYNSVRARDGSDAGRAPGARPLPGVCAPPPAPEDARLAADLDAVLRATPAGTARDVAARVLRDMGGDVGAAIEALVAGAGDAFVGNEAAGDDPAAAGAAAPQPSPVQKAPQKVRASVRRALRVAAKVARKAAPKTAAAAEESSGGAAAASLHAPLAALRL